MLTDSSEMKASQALRETLLQPRRSSSEMKERRRRYFRHESVSLLQPPRLSSVSVFRVDEPTAVSRLMEWSVRLLQWERSSFVKWGIWRITRRRVESLMSRPASRRHCMVRS